MSLTRSVCHSKNMEEKRTPPQVSRNHTHAAVGSIGPSFVFFRFFFSFSSTCKPWKATIYLCVQGYQRDDNFLPLDPPLLLLSSKEGSVFFSVLLLGVYVRCNGHEVSDQHVPLSLTHPCQSRRIFPLSCPVPGVRKKQRLFAPPLVTKIPRKTKHEQHPPNSDEKAMKASVERKSRPLPLHLLPVH